MGSPFRSAIILISMNDFSFMNLERSLELAITTLQFKMNAKLSPHRFWPCHENGLIKPIQTIPHKLYVSFKLTSLYCGLRIILVYPNPQQREADLTLTYRLWGIV